MGNIRRYGIPEGARLCKVRSTETGRLAKRDFDIPYEKSGKPRRIPPEDLLEDLPEDLVRIFGRSPH
jgi:hypothetical protein